MSSKLFGFDDPVHSNWRLIIYTVSSVISDSEGHPASRGSERDSETHPKTLSVNSLVLSKGSDYYRQKIEAWNEDESKTIEMYVHEGQQPFAIELIKFMYTGEVVYTKGGDIIQLLAVAHQYLVHKCEEDCMKLLFQQGVLDIQMAADLCNIIPEGAPFMKTVFDKVKMQLLDLFGDLEIIWRAKGNMAKRKQEFLDLPLAIVEWLLASSELQVSSENTVFVAGARWVEHNLAELNEREVAAVWGRLVRTMKFACMTPLFLVGVVSKVEWPWARVDEEIVGAAMSFLLLSAQAKLEFLASKSGNDKQKYICRPASVVCPRRTYGVELESINQLKDVCESKQLAFCCGYLFSTQLVKDSDKDALLGKIVSKGAGVPTTTENVTVELGGDCGFSMTVSREWEYYHGYVMKVGDIVDTCHIIDLKELPLLHQLAVNGFSVSRERLTLPFTLDIHLGNKLNLPIQSNFPSQRVRNNQR